jgi:hypothetical protein
MAEDRLKILEERLTRLEANLQRASAAGGPSAIFDPTPWTPANWSFVPRPSPVVDPAPWPYGWCPPRWPPYYISDPPPPPGFVVDPAPRPQGIDPGVLQSSLSARIGRVADPPPPDITRLTVVQLESALHSIAAEKARLDSMEQMVKKQLETAKKQQPG